MLDSFWNTKNKLSIVFSLFFLVFCFIFFRIFYLSHNFGQKKSSNYNFSSKESKFSRLNILDRNGMVLATNIPVSSVFMNPKKIIDINFTVERLLSVFSDLKKQKLLNSFYENQNKTFVWVKRDISLQEKEKLINEFFLPGIEIENYEKRVYPYEKLLSHVIGYVNRDMEGLAGIERYFNDFLNCSKCELTKKNLPTVLELTIDIRIQNILYQELEAAIELFQANAAFGIVVNPNNGDILAMVSKPDFDPNNLNIQTKDNFFNTITQANYEIGSCMKAITLSIGFDTNTISLDDVYMIEDMKIGNYLIKDTHKMNRLSGIDEIFLHSSNVGASKIILEIGKDKVYSYLQELGLFDRIEELEISEKAYPLFLPYDACKDLNLMTMSYGYGIAQSPAHFVKAFIPIINGGFLYPITLIKKQKSALPKKIFSEMTSNKMKKLLRLAVEQGTGRNAIIGGYNIGGKTGTAYKNTLGKYHKSERISSFIGVLPIEKPKYVLMVGFDTPQKNAFSNKFLGGASTAAPIAQKIFKKIIALDAIESILE